MERERLRHALELTTNLAVLTVCIAVVLVLVRGRTPQQHLALTRGSAFPAIENVKYGDADRTLILALSTQCHFCQESLPFYRALTQAKKNRSQIVVLFPNSDSEVRHFVEHAGLTVDTVAEQNFDKLKILGTPTLILVDRTGKIADVWTGELPPSGEQQVIASL